MQDIGASVYEEEALFTDQIETLVPTTLQTSLVILICMAVVCSIFMCSVFTVLVAVSSIISICIGKLHLFNSFENCVIDERSVYF